MQDPVVTTLYIRATQLRVAQQNYIADGTRNEDLGNEVRLAAERLDAILKQVEEGNYVSASEIARAKAAAR